MPDAKTHMFALRDSSGKVEIKTMEAETFEIAQALVEKKWPGAEIVHAMCSDTHLRINKLGFKGEAIAKQVRLKSQEIERVNTVFGSGGEVG